jgi:gliding motility-associated-like protein
MNHFSTIWCFLFLLLPLFTRGQQENLILNGSLEEYISCPDVPGNAITKARYWSAGIPGGISSTDYFHGCAGYVPSNNSFYQEAAKGIAFFRAGIEFTPFDTIIHGLREFAAGQLKECLIPNKRYHLSFAVCPPFFFNTAALGFDCFEVLFHPNEFPFDAENFGISSRYHEVTEQVIPMPTSGPITETGKWHRLSVEFTAKGDECYFTVGCFKRILEENTAQLDTVNPGVIIQFGVWYLYDDFVLTEIVEDTLSPMEPVVPNVFTPNGDGINDFWVIDNLPSGTTVAIYNRWGQQVYISQNYNNDWGGKDLPVGNYFAELVFRDLPPRRLTIFLKR